MDVRTGMKLGFLGLVIIAVSGCIAVSREVRQVPVTSDEIDAVLDGGQFDVDQEWACQPVGEFELNRERLIFNDTIDDWLEDGWQLADFDVVTLPDENGRPGQICLVATFRR